MVTEGGETVSDAVASQLSVRDLKTHLPPQAHRTHHGREAAGSGCQQPASEGDGCRHRQLEWPEVRVPSSEPVRLKAWMGDQAIPLVTLAVAA